ncbi:MAG: hypothetical protein AAF357_17990, partial [Verrucomicrobiota bacterium]
HMLVRIGPFQVIVGCIWRDDGDDPCGVTKPIEVGKLKESISRNYGKLLASTSPPALPALVADTSNAGK